MRNLPQSLATHVGSAFKSDGRSSEESYESTIYNTRWPEASDRLHSIMAPSPGQRLSRQPVKFSSRTGICASLVKHRVRLLLTFVSLVFLSLFLLVIYRQFGLVVFASTLSLIVVPGLAALIYAKRLKAKEQERARQRALNRSQSQRASQRQHKTVQIYSTDVEMCPPIEMDPSGPKLQRKPTQQKITIQLPPTVSDR